MPTGQPDLDSPSLSLFAGDCSVKLTVRTNITVWKNSLVRLVPQEYLVSKGKERFVDSEAQLQRTLHVLSCLVTLTVYHCVHIYNIWLSISFLFSEDFFFLMYFNTVYGHLSRQCLLGIFSSAFCICTQSISASFPSFLGS